MLLPGRHGEESSQNYRYGFNGMEGDDEVKGKGNSYDFGARILDPRIGRWLSRDPLESRYVSISTYAFVANTPIQAYDPDGRLIIFVNGFVGIGGAVPLAPYWVNPRTGVAHVVENAIDYFHDDNIKYVDGSCVGDGYFLEDLGGSTADSRYSAGYGFAASILEDVKAAVENGEEINFVSHSMGVAYAEGMIAYFANEGIDISKSIEFAAADARDIDIGDKANNETIKQKILSVFRIQITTTQDYTLDKSDPLSDGIELKIPGVDLYGEAAADGSIMVPHKENPIEVYKYDFHNVTKWNTDAFDMVKDLESRNADYFTSKTYGDCHYNYFYVSDGKYKFNYLYLGDDFLKYKRSTDSTDPNKAAVYYEEYCK